MPWCMQSSLWAFVRVEDVDRVLDGAGFEMADIPRAALFLAGKVFQRYRAQGIPGIALAEGETDH
jgi:hypothetical protein